MKTCKRGGLNFLQHAFVKLMMEKPRSEWSREFMLVCAELAGYKGQRKKLKEGEHQLDKVLDGLMRNPRVLAALEGCKIEERLSERFGPENIKLQLISIANSCLTDYASWDESGVRIKSSALLSRAQAQNIVKVKQTETKYGKNIEIELERRLDALDQLARIHGMYKETIAVKDELDEELESMTDEELEANIIQILRARPAIAEMLVNTMNVTIEGEAGR